MADDAMDVEGNDKGLKSSMEAQQVSTRTTSTSPIPTPVPVASNESPSAKEILRKNMEMEKKIKELKEGPNAKTSAAEINRLFSALRTDYRTLIVEHPMASSELGKDIDGMLWKSCFYKSIEDFRKSIRRTVSILDEEAASLSGTGGGDGGEGEVDDGGNEAQKKDSSYYDKVRLHLAKLKQRFQTFLHEGVEFYIDLMKFLEAMYKSNVQARTEIVKTIHRCLLYLGDLTRYQLSNTSDEDEQEKGCNIAESYYERAAFLLPSSGNPQNQLAVLDMYRDNQVVAVYHYCRSVMAKEPFWSGLDNLGVLFSKNASSYQKLEMTNPAFLNRNGANGGVGGPLLVGGGPGGFAPDVSKKERTNAFLISFVRLHGILFEWVDACVPIMNSFETQTSASPSATNGSPEKESKRRKIPKIKSQEFVEFVRLVMLEFDQLLSISSFGEKLLVQLLVVSMFSVYNGARLSKAVVKEEKAKRARGDHDENSDAAMSPFQADTLYHSVSESLALIIIFNLVTKTASRIQMAVNTIDKSRKISIGKVLPLISVFAEWASVCPEYLSGGEGPSESQLNPAYAGLIADTTLLQEESRARSGMRAAMMSLRDYIDSALARSNSAPNGPPASNDLSVGEIEKPLKEHIYLRGLVPVASLYEKYFEGMDFLDKPSCILSEDVARVRRLRVLRSFLRDWLKPTADRELAEAQHRMEMMKKKQAGEDILRAGKGNVIAGMLPIKLSAVTAKGPSKKSQKSLKQARKKANKGGGDANNDPHTAHGKKSSKRKEKKAKKETALLLERRPGAPGTIRRIEDNEEFPPLNPQNLSLAAASASSLNVLGPNGASLLAEKRGFATSNMYISTAPTGPDPFENDEDKAGNEEDDDEDEDDDGDDDDDEEEEDDDEDGEDDEDEDEGEEGGHDDRNGGMDSGDQGGEYQFQGNVMPWIQNGSSSIRDNANMMSHPAGLMGMSTTTTTSQPASSSALDGLFVRNPSLYRDFDVLNNGNVMNAASLGMGAVPAPDRSVEYANMSTSMNNLLDDDDDDIDKADDVVVFRPAFSRGSSGANARAGLMNVSPSLPLGGQEFPTSSTSPFGGSIPASSSGGLMPFGALRNVGSFGNHLNEFPNYDGQSMFGAQQQQHQQQQQQQQQHQQLYGHQQASMPNPNDWWVGGGSHLGLGAGNMERRSWETGPSPLPTFAHTNVPPPPGFGAPMQQMNHLPSAWMPTSSKGPMGESEWDRINRRNPA